MFCVCVCVCPEEWISWNKIENWKVSVISYFNIFPILLGRCISCADAWCPTSYIYVRRGVFEISDSDCHIRSFSTWALISINDILDFVSILMLVNVIIIPWWCVYWLSNMYSMDFIVILIFYSFFFQPVYFFLFNVEHFIQLFVIIYTIPFHSRYKMCLFPLHL